MEEMRMSPIIARVDKLKNVAGGRETLSFVLRKTELAPFTEMRLSHAVPLTFQGVAENFDRIIKITGTVSACFSAVCDRCGDVTDVTVTTDFSEAFTNLPEKVSEGEEADDGVHFFEGDSIDLLPYIEQALFLAMPMKILCREDCRGLCPTCGQNLNNKECSCDQSPIDPRLAVLADLLKEDD